jgi:hypothetical protein
VSEIEPLSDTEITIAVEPLAQQWAKKYLQNLLVDTCIQDYAHERSLSNIVSKEERKNTAQKVMSSLRSVSVKAWNKTEELLADQIIQHGIDFNSINPWEISGDCFRIYQKALDVYTQSGEIRSLAVVMKLAATDNSMYQEALEVYTEQIAPNELVRVIGADLGAIRKKYTSLDPRAIGFVSMQFHYTGQMLIEPLEGFERSLIGAYFKVIDDHLYMPLQRAYLAAAKHNYNSPIILAVQTLLPVSTKIARRISQRIIEMFPRYQTLSGRLTDEVVRTSSIRDVEMFQVYLWVSALEGNISAIQEELFPLCVMIYPTLKVQWELVRQMLHLLRFEIQDHLTDEQVNILMPYLQVLSSMFSSEILE